MKPTTKAILIFLAITLLIIGVGTLVTRCSKEKKADVVQGHKDTLANALDIDSIATAEYNKLRALYDDSLKQSREQAEQVRIVYRDRVKYDTKLEIRYRYNPTLELCDSVIDSKNRRIATLEQLDSLNVKTIVQQQGLIASSDRLIQSKNQTISQLSTGYDKAIKDLEKAYKNKPIVISAGVGYGLTNGAKAQPFAGLHIGYKLFQF